MIALIVGIIIGFLMCIPIGPLNVIVMNVTLKRHERYAQAVALGGSFMDFIYFAIILKGLSFLNFEDQLNNSVKFLGVVVILLLGVKELFFSRQVTQKDNDSYTKRGILASVGFGMFIYASNPTLIFTMSALGTFVKGLEFFPLDETNIFLVSFGLAIGSLSWFLLLVFFIRKYQEMIIEKYYIHFTKISGILMILLSLLMIRKLFGIEI